MELILQFFTKEGKNGAYFMGMSGMGIPIPKNVSIIFTKAYRVAVTINRKKPPKLKTNLLRFFFLSISFLAVIKRIKKIIAAKKPKTIQTKAVRPRRIKIIFIIVKIIIIFYFP